jgi:hypothetical protein
MIIIGILRNVELRFDYSWLLLQQYLVVNVLTKELALKVILLELITDLRLNCFNLRLNVHWRSITFWVYFTRIRVIPKNIDGILKTG